MFLRSMFQLSVSPAAFLRVKAKMALPCFRASLRSASLALRAAWIASKASEEGNLSTLPSATGHRIKPGARALVHSGQDSPFLRDILAVFGKWAGWTGLGRANAARTEGGGVEYLEMLGG